MTNEFLFDELATEKNKARGFFFRLGPTNWENGTV